MPELTAPSDPPSPGPEVWASQRPSAILGDLAGGFNRARFRASGYCRGARIHKDASRGQIRGFARAAVKAGHKPRDAQYLYRPDLGGEHITGGARKLAETLFRLLFHVAITPEKGRIATGKLTHYIPVTQGKLADLLAMHAGLRGIGGHPRRHRSTVHRYCQELSEAKLLDVSRREQVKRTGHARANLLRVKGMLKTALADCLALWHAMCQARTARKQSKEDGQLADEARPRGAVSSAQRVGTLASYPNSPGDLDGWEPPDDPGDLIAGLPRSLQSVGSKLLRTPRGHRSKR